jgi:diphosphomevalonate decarboxylase
MSTATARAHPNIAFIKYWGNLDATLRIPANGSISMNLEGLETRTTVTFDVSLAQDQLILNGQPASEEARQRVSRFLDRVRTLADLNSCAKVESQNNFPTGAGIASSASAFAALSLAASAAAGLQIDERECSRLARRGSGSACRSVPGGFVEWQAGRDDESSYAYLLAPAEHWDLVDCVAVVSQAHKPTGSTQGHVLADSSPLQAARVASAVGRLEACRKAILQRDFAALAEVAELDCNLMHAVMMTSQPPLLYWQPATLAVMHAVQDWRAGGLPVFYTIDAGPNVHVLFPAEVSPEVAGRLGQIEGVKEVLRAHPGGPARLV